VDNGVVGCMSDSLEVEETALVSWHGRIPAARGAGLLLQGKCLALAGACVMSRMYNVLISIAGNTNCDDSEMGSMLI